MNWRKLILTVPIFIILLGCLSNDSKEQVTPETTSAIIDRNRTPTPTKIDPSPFLATETRIPSRTATPTPTLTPTSVPTVEPSTLLESRCGQVITNQDEVTNSLFAGIIIESVNNDQNGSAILGVDGAESPAFVWLTAQQGWQTAVSPDGHQLAYFDSDFTTEPTTIEISVLELETGQIYQTHMAYEGIEEMDGWLNNTQLFATSLPVMTEQLTLITWSPFSNEEEALAVELTGFGFHDTSTTANAPTMPVIDPLLEFVIYPCYSSCGGSEYFVKNLDTNEIVWTMDMDEPFPEGRDIPVWSPDGQYIAVIGNNRYQDILIFNRDGTIIDVISLPEPARLAGASGLFWSPNSSYLGFRRLSIDANGDTQQSLAFYDLENDVLVDLCVDPSAPSLMYWSPDSTKIAYVASPDPFADFDKKILEGYVVDIYTGDAFKFYETDGQEWDFLVGWATPFSSDSN